mmetsp:Transcript_17710/g.36260  ORF Transcript_17710/g.36260 Transcript_17710/m.36260 type:complete len:213 (-) Transcript_17710:348-986(-)
MLQKERLASGVGRANVLEGVKVLRQQEQVHDVGRGGAFHAARKVHDGAPEAVDDGGALLGHPEPGEVLGLLVRLRGLDEQYLLAVRFGCGGVLEAPLRVDLVHRRFHASIGGEIRHEGLENGVAEVLHLVLQLIFHGVRQLVLGREGHVERPHGDGAADHVLHIGANLGLGVRELVPSDRERAQDEEQKNRMDAMNDSISVKTESVHVRSVC